jgi:4-amino-4-deoxy-L-arabinose transferase-like glycosyltransferase
MVNGSRSGWWSEPLWLALALGALAALRLWFCAAVELSPDEAYYFAWSERLDWGYFDHGPLVAWVIRAGTALLGVNEIGVRSGAVVLSLITAVGIYFMTERLYGGRTAFWTALLAAWLPLFSAGAVIHTPDAELSACWIWCAYFALRAIDRGRTEHWVACGALAGMGLLAKASALLAPAGLVLFWLTTPQGRRALLSPGPAACLLAAGLVGSPYLVWCAYHQGGAFSFQVGRVFSAEGDLLGVPAFLGGQLGLVSPLVWAGTAVFALVGCRRQARRVRNDIYLLWCLGAPLFFITFALSFVRRVEANWPGPAYLTLYPALPWLVGGGWYFLKRLKLWSWLAGMLAVTISLAIHAQALRPWLPLGPDKDPTRQLRGWRELASVAALRADAFSARLAAQGYGPASELRFYSGRQVFYLPAHFRRSQYDLWPRPEPPARMLLLLPSSSTEARAGRDFLRQYCPGQIELLAPPTAGDQRFSRLQDFGWWLCRNRLPIPGEET